MQIFSGIYKGRKLISPKGLATRPTSAKLREALFNICQGTIEGAAFLDLFAGTGAMGLEALSRGAKISFFVDHDKESIRCIKENVARIGVQKESSIIYGDVFTVLRTLAKRGHRFDIIYADPPYDLHADGKSLTLRLITDFEKLIGEGLCLLKKGGDLFLEDDAKALSKNPLKAEYLTLQGTRKMGRAALQHWRSET